MVAVAPPEAATALDGGCKSWLERKAIPSADTGPTYKAAASKMIVLMFMIFPVRLRKKSLRCGDSTDSGG